MNAMNTWRARDVLVISDLHLAAERGRGLFQADAELAAFFDWAHKHAPDSVVVLAGDILDFLVSDGNDESTAVFAPERAPERVRAIIKKHPEVFAALAKLACSPRHRLVWLGGNHDPEMALPEVRQVIEHELCNQATHTLIKWLVNGEGARLRVGAANVLIEHGDLYDSWNRVDHHALLQAISLANRGLHHEGLIDEYRFAPPPGSHLVTEHLSAIRQQYPWVEWLKPEWRAVVPVLHEILPMDQKLKVLKLARHWRDLVKTSIITEIRSKTDVSQLTRGRKSAATAPDDLTRYFLKWMDEVEQPATRGKSRDKSIAKLTKGLREVAKHDRSFDLMEEEKGNKKEDLTFLVRHGVDLIVHGHTHAARAYGLHQNQGLYLNTGTWGRLLQLPSHDAGKEQWHDFLASLLDGQQQGEIKPTFVRITEQTDSHTHAALLRWEASSPSTLATWQLDSSVGKWVKEG